MTDPHEPRCICRGMVGPPDPHACPRCRNAVGPMRPVATVRAHLYLNGQLLIPGADYQVDGERIAFEVRLQRDDVILRVGVGTGAVERAFVNTGVPAGAWFDLRTGLPLARVETKREIDDPARVKYGPDIEPGSVDDLADDLDRVRQTLADSAIGGSDWYASIGGKAGR